MLSSDVEMLEWLRSNVKCLSDSFGSDDSQFTITADKSVDVHDHVVLINGAHYLPVQFGIAYGNFLCERHLYSFKGLPSSVMGDLKVTSGLACSLDGLPNHIGKALDISVPLVTSLSGIHKHVKHAVTIKLRDMVLPTNLLGLMFVKGLQYFDIQPCHLMSSSSFQVVGIIQKHLNKREHKDVLQCQEELIENGYAQYAKF